MKKEARRLRDKAVSSPVLSIERLNRFRMGGVGFDVQVKRMHNVKNEMTRLVFKRECKRRLSRIQKPWFINFWVSDKFEPKHLNEFFSDIRAQIDTFTPTIDTASAMKADQYLWVRDGQTLVRFSFLLKNSGKPGISIGTIHESGTVDGMAERVDTAAIRKAVERQLKKSGPTLARDVSETQSNLVVIQAESSLWMDDDTMSDVLYGDEGIALARTTDGRWVQRSHRAPGGLFDGRQFSRICGVVLVPQNATPIDDTFTGDYFPNPVRLHHIQQHPKLFDEVMFNLPRAWIDGNAWEPMAHEDDQASPPDGAR